jgi:tetratricopeptide (TPR) repeat protein
LLWALAALLLFSGCSLPRIIILKDPLTPEEHLNLGVAYEKQREFEPAIKEYTTAAKKLPRAYLYLGNVYFQKKELGKAEAYYRKAIKMTPAMPMRIIIWPGSTIQKGEPGGGGGSGPESHRPESRQGGHLPGYAGKIREMKKTAPLPLIPSSPIYFFFRGISLGAFSFPSITSR